jgi:glutamate-1-semialdehyde 2,1-aminomutase
MDSPLPILALSAVAITGAATVFPKLNARLALSRAKHRSLTGHSKMSRMVARLVPFYEFGIDDFFRSDGAPAEVALQRQDGFFKLAALYKERFPEGRRMTLHAAERISDLQFTEAYRVPFQYSRLVREHLGTSAFMTSSAGVTVTDPDGNMFYDLTGSYGVNIFGNDFYKECIAKAAARAHALGPVLGSYHPVITDNVARLCAISGLDEVSFHMSGTEAVMQAVRLARYHTGRSHLVRLRRLSRLVGRRAARRRQSDLAARDLYAGRHVRTDTPCPADTARHRLRAGQSTAGVAPQCRRAGRFRAGRQLAKRSFRSHRV